MLTTRLRLVCLLGATAWACSVQTPTDSDQDGGPPQGADLGSNPADASTISGPALKLRVRSSDDLSPLPCRVIITAVAPTPATPLHSDGATAAVISPGVMAITDGVVLATGEGVVPLPYGTYDLVLLQGPEYEQVRRRVSIGQTDIVTVDEVLEHSVHTSGWLAADMHLHTARSYDSTLAPEHRVLSEVAAGIQVLVPTDHIWHNDLQPILQGFGYTGRAVSIPGSEYGFKYGHLGVYPVQFDPSGDLWGAPPWEAYANWGNLTPPVAFPMIHELPGQPVVIINHPRLLPDLGYFTNIGWPHTPNEPLADASFFDGMEVLNGYSAGPGDVTALLRDWFFFLSQGYRITGLGNSDTHRMDWLTSGYPRTWLLLATDDPSRLLPSDLRDALIGMRAVASTGPFIHLRVDGHELGDTVLPSAGAGTVSIEIEADAANWIDLSRVLLYQNGVLVKNWSVDGTARVHPALQVQTTLPVTTDGWIVAMAVGDTPLPTQVIGAVQGGTVRPLAMTNPVWIDFNGDGKVQPPPLGAPPDPLEEGAGTKTQAALLPQGSVGLHPPLDCQPDAYLEWLERTSPTK